MKMSAIIQQTRQLYRNVLKVEFFLFIISGIVAIFLPKTIACSLLLGLMVGFIPHWVFVGWVFFRKSAERVPKITTFYRGEGLKWGCTILFFFIVFKCYSELHYLTFFISYLISIFSNGILPIRLKKDRY